MKAFFFFSLIFCLSNIVFGLECNYSGKVGKYFEECDFQDHFCIHVKISGPNIDLKEPTSYYGCSREMLALEKHGVKCSESGHFNITIPNDVIIEYHCCEKNNCN